MDRVSYEPLSNSESRLETVAKINRNFTTLTAKVNEIIVACGGTAPSAPPVVVVPAANKPPVAIITLTQSDLTVRLSGETSTDVDGSVVSWAWDYGDGTPATGKTPAAHTYSSAGTYVVSLVVTDDDGATGTTSKAVSVTAPSSFVLGTTKPVSANSGAGVIRAAPTGNAGSRGAVTLGGSTVLTGWTINGDVSISGNAKLIDCIVHGRVKATGSSGSPVVENCIVDGDGSNYGANGTAKGGDVWLLQSTMTSSGVAVFRHNTVKARAISYRVNGIGYRNFRSYRNEISQVVDGFSITAKGATNVVIQGDYVHDLMFVRPDPNHSDWTHNDCIQYHVGTGTTIEGVNLEATTGPLKKGTNPYGAVVTGQAIGFTCDAGNVSGVTVRSSWVSGGAHGIIAIVGSNSAKSIGTFDTIRFGRNSKSNPMQMSAQYSGNKYAGLTYEDNGKNVPVAKGES